MDQGGEFNDRYKYQHEHFRPTRDTDSPRHRGRLADAYVTPTMIMAVFITVLVGALIMFAMVYLGLRIANYQTGLDVLNANQSEKNITIGNLTYTTQAFDYTYSNTSIKNEADASKTQDGSTASNQKEDTPKKDEKPEQEKEDHGTKLLASIGETAHDYLIINSNTKLGDLLHALKVNNPSAPDYHVEPDFFISGSIVALVAEAPGLSYFSVDKITRDENYNLSVNTSRATNQSDQTLRGKLILVKVTNVQPQDIVINSR